MDNNLKINNHGYQNHSEKCIKDICKSSSTRLGKYILYNEIAAAQGEFKKGDDLIVSTITNPSTSLFAPPALSDSLILVGTIFLLVLLVLKEVVCASSDQRLQKLNRALNISLVPLLCAFFLVLFVKVGEVLR